MVDNHKAFLESLITNQGPFNGSYETYWPFNAEDTPRHAGRLTDSRANFLVNRSVLRNIRSRKFSAIKVTYARLRVDVCACDAKSNNFNLKIVFLSHFSTDI